MNSSLIRAYVGLGSNMNDPRSQLRNALAALDAIPGTCCVAYSSLFWSKPLGTVPQPDYLNAVAAVDTQLSAPELLKELHLIEELHGRVRGAERWVPRTLDLDLLLYGDSQLEGDVLTVPHPGLPERNFVLYPLHEIAPKLHIPGAGSLQALLERCSSLGLQAVPAAV
jgi:2-amino-4-hydroxy-6-hydroxymethyldihydropteridine diphosphokinase